MLLYQLSLLHKGQCVSRLNCNVTPFAKTEETWGMSVGIYSEGGSQQTKASKPCHLSPERWELSYPAASLAGLLSKLLPTSLPSQMHPSVPKVLVCPIPFLPLYSTAHVSEPWILSSNNLSLTGQRRMVRRQVGLRAPGKEMAA